MKKTISLVLLLTFVLTAKVANADFTFGEPTDLASTINNSSGAGSPSFSTDGLEIYFDSDNRPGGYGGYDIWVATRKTVDEDWGIPVNLGPPVNSSGRDGTPCISSDGLALYFDSIRPGGFGSYDLYVTTRRSKSEPWSEPLNLGPVVNRQSQDYFPELSADGLSLYFESVRPGGSAEYTVWVTRRKTKDDPWEEPVDLGLGDAGSPNISSNELTLFFCSVRPGGFGNLDMWVTRRATLTDSWGTPANLGPKVNTSYGDGYGRLSPDDSSLHISVFGSGTISKIRQIPIIPIVDLNSDGIVDAADMCIVVDHWGENYSLCDIGPTPLGDGIIDVQDLIALAEHLFEDVDDPTLVAHLALDEIEGNIASDSTNDNDGTVYGDPPWQPEGGMVDGALQLDGIDDYISTPFVLNPADGKFSVFVWIKGGAPGQAVLSQMGGANWLCTDSLEGNLMTELKASGRGSAELLSQAVITDGNWHRIGLVWDGTNRTLYVDGLAVAEDTQNNLEGSANGLYIGTGKAMEPGSFWSGLIDDVRIYNRAVKP